MAKEEPIAQCKTTETETDSNHKLSHIVNESAVPVFQDVFLLLRFIRIRVSSEMNYLIFLKMFPVCLLHLLINILFCVVVTRGHSVHVPLEGFLPLNKTYVEPSM